MNIYRHHPKLWKCESLSNAREMISYIISATIIYVYYHHCKSIFFVCYFLREIKIRESSILAQIVVNCFGVLIARLIKE